LARETLDLALEDGDTGAQAAALNALGNVSEEDDPAKALEYYRRALDLLRASAGLPELGLMVSTNLGGCLVKAHRFAEGMALLQEAHQSARAAGLRRVAALSATRMAEAHLQRGDARRADRALLESDALASDGRDPYNDILFLNSYHRWQAARLDGNPTREKIAFGRLRHLRSLIERRFAEVDAFDHWVGGHRRTES
jgi:Tfp pilus assembly protein PilF